MSVEDLKAFNEWIRHAEAFILFVVIPAGAVAAFVSIVVGSRLMATWDIWIESKRNRKDKP